MAILSKAQQKVIDAMADGFTLERSKIVFDEFVSFHTKDGKVLSNPKMQTFEFLERNKFIERDMPTRWGYIFRLTDLGKSKATPKKN